MVFEMHETNTIEVLALVCACVYEYAKSSNSNQNMEVRVCERTGIREKVEGKGKLFHFSVVVAAAELIKYSDQMRKI